MSVKLSNNVGYTPLRSNSNVNYARRDENMEAPKKSNTGKYVAAGVTLAAVAAAIVYRKPIGNALKNLMGKVKMPDVSKVTNKIKTQAADLAKTAEAKAADIAGKVKTTVSDAAAKVAEKAGETISGFKAPNIGGKLSKVWQGAKNYAVKGWNFAKKYGKKAVELVKTVFHKLFHKPVASPTVTGLIK